MCQPHEIPGARSRASQRLMHPLANAASRELRVAFSAFPSGVAAVAALDSSNHPQGIAVSSFTSVSLDPPLVSVCVAKSSTTWPTLSLAKRIGVSVLAADQGALAAALSSKSPTRFDGIAWEANEDGAVLVVGAALRLDCAIEHRYPGGDHEIVVLRIRSFAAEHAREPLVFHRSQYRELAV